MGEMFVENDLFGTAVVAENKYSKKVGIPQYLPKNECPKLSDVVNTYKYDQLMSDIDKANITEEQKVFLRLAATRHIVFNYEKIADYYAHQGEDMQKLMEQSALVLIDLNDAIANGYVKLSENIENILRESGVVASGLTYDKE